MAASRPPCSATNAAPRGGIEARPADTSARAAERASIRSPTSSSSSTSRRLSSSTARLYPRRRPMRDHAGMHGFHEGQKIWVEQTDGSQRAAIFVGEAELTWFGGAPGVYVVYPDSRSGEEVDMLRVVARD